MEVIHMDHQDIDDDDSLSHMKLIQILSLLGCHTVDQQSANYVSEQPIGPSFKGQAVQEF